MESYLRLANLYYKTGRREEAIQQLNQAMQIDPSDIRVQEGLEYLQAD
jgi:tetratricopeptide (TPR) repeat protein